MAKETLCPPVKPVPKSGGVQQGGSHSTLTTPNQPVDKYGVWAGKGKNSSVFGKK